MVNMDLGHHWLRKWLVAWQHQAITWTKIDLSSVKPRDIHLMAIWKQIPVLWITKISLIITHPKFDSNSQKAKELMGWEMIIIKNKFDFDGKVKFCIF